MTDHSAEAIFGLYASGACATEIAGHACATEIAGHACATEIAGQVSCTPEEVQAAIREAIALRPHIERRENRVTWELHRAVAEKLDRVDGAHIVHEALVQAGVMKARQRSSLARSWMERWEELLQGDLNELKSAMLEVSHDSEDLRQMSPFPGALSQEERQLAIKKATIHRL